MRGLKVKTMDGEGKPQETTLPISYLKSKETLTEDEIVAVWEEGNKDKIWYLWKRLNDLEEVTGYRVVRRYWKDLDLYLKHFSQGYSWHPKTYQWGEMVHLLRKKNEEVKNAK